MSDPLVLNERPLPLRGEGTGGLAALEREIGAWLRQGAEAAQALAEQERRHEDELQGVLLGVIEAVDAFERVFRHLDPRGDPAATWPGNFRTIMRLLQSLLAENGVSEMDSVGAEFDPRWHRVADTVPDPSRPEGTIAEVIHGGYRWNDRLLRKAQVVVVRHEDGRETDGQGSRH